MNIVICDYGCGNIGSIANILRRVGANPIVENNPENIAKADKIILPGVGHFDHCMASFRAKNMESPIRQAINNGAKLLGICVGMQMLLESSEEGVEKGLGLIKGTNLKFNFPKEYHKKIPHMGWNLVYPQFANRLLPQTNQERRFYFVHSYYASCADDANILAKCQYGIGFACAIFKDNIYGVQFHPEKSHQYGMELMKAFIAL